VGLFGSIFKGIGKVVGGVAKIGVGALKSGLVPLPFGGAAGKILGGLLHAKAPMGHTQLKLNIPPLVLRGKTLKPVVKIGASSYPTITAVRRSPVLPGGAVATRAGVVNRPLSLSGDSARSLTASPRKRRRRKSGTSTHHRSRSSSKRRRGGRRKLKFGSPAWRKKYLGHGRKRRKRRAA
jgi:hypothetical protein